MAPIADDHSERDDSPDRRGNPEYRIEDERAASIGMGSGDAELEAAITKLRGSIIRTINELDRFCMTVRRARESVAQMAELVDEDDTEPEDDDK